MAATRSRRWLRFVLWAFAIILAAPAVVVAAYRFLPPPGTPLMLIRVAQGEGWDYRWVDLDAMAPSLPGLVVAAEDNLFCQHWGIDLAAFREQVDAALEGDRPRGASTISMQLAKNLFLWPSRSVVRKGLEFWLTPYVEALLSKRRIVELYLNVVELGPGIYGAEAAAQRHFGVPAARLTQGQASLLAAVLPNPRAWSAAQPGDYVRERATVYRRRAGQLGPDLLGCLKDGG